MADVTQNIFSFNLKLFCNKLKTYTGLSSATGDNSDSRSDWTDDVDDADDGRNMIGTDPWAQESVTGVTGSEEDLKPILF